MHAKRKLALLRGAKLMVDMPSSADIKKRYEDAAGRVATRYKEGVDRNTDWHTKATSEKAESNYAQRMQDVIANKTRQKGLAGSSQSEWKTGVATKGASSIGPNMRASSDKQVKGYEPYRSKLSGVSLTERGPPGIGNMVRANEIVQAMLDERKAQKGF